MIKITLKHEKSIILYLLGVMIFYKYEMKRRFEEKHISKENLIKKLKHSILTQKDVIILAKAHVIKIANVL